MKKKRTTKKKVMSFFRKKIAREKSGVLLQHVLSTLKPNVEEKKRFTEKVNLFLKQLQSRLHGARAVLGGSGAKGTWLAGNHDVDVFVRFEAKTWRDRPSEELSDNLHSALQKAFPKKKITRLHGSRDYFQLQEGGYTFEMVPILKITKAGQAKNITDISPLHSIWVHKHVKNKDEVLLAKQFCKAQGLYGAESHIQGFSGYALEILLATYNTFEGFLRAATTWKAKEVIDPAKHYPHKDALFHLNKSKQLSPIIIIDPVDRNRNAAAALSKEKLQILQKKSREYLQKPLEHLFTKQAVDLEKLQHQGHVVVIQVVPVTGKRDVVGAKLLKCYEFLKKNLEGYKVKASGWDWNQWYFVVDQQILPTVHIRKGPPVTLQEYAQDFKKKNKDTYVENGVLYARIHTAYPLLRDFVAHLVKDQYVLEKVRKIEGVQVLGHSARK